MLIKKIIIFYNNNHKNNLFYFFKNKKIKILIQFSNCLFKKHNVVSKILNYSYNLKLNSVVSYIIELNVNYFIEFIFSFNNFKTFNKLKNYSKLKHLYSVLRSPFVYKKSMEQFYFSSYKLKYETNTCQYNFLLKNYQNFFIKEELKKNSVFKFVFKITFFFI